MEPVEDVVLRQFLGGSGLGTYLLLRFGAASLEPLAPESPLVFSFSPLVGSPLTTSAKFAVVSKSPLTHRINDSLASSGFAISGKKCGCDAIVVTGRASEPSILVIDDGDVRVEPAGDLWGRTITQAQHQLRERLGGEFRSAVIGPAGELGVPFATISHDGRHAGRGGSGAVLGAKNIKAVAVRGTHRCQWAEPDRLVELARDLSDRSFGPATAKYRELGTAANLLLFNRLNSLPTRNFQQGRFRDAELLSPEKLSVEREKIQSSCIACTIGCEHIYSLKSEGEVSGRVRLEYENLFALGPLCDLGDADDVLAASKRCDQLGLDIISTGGTIAFAMECVERGLLEEPWLRFGSGKAVLRAIDLIGAREGVGELLSLGSRRMAEELGSEARSFAAHVKGLEIPGYEPREMQTMALGFAVGSRGADHNRSGAYEADFSDQVDRRKITPESAKFAVETEDRAALIDSLILCKFLRGVFGDLFQESAQLLACITGWDVTGDELRTVARRCVSARKLFNVKAGWTPGEDVLPQRFLSTSLPGDDPAVLAASSLRRAVTAYNQLRGWTDDGWLTDACLDEFGLTTLAQASE